MITESSIKILRLLFPPIGKAKHIKLDPPHHPVTPEYEEKLIGTITNILDGPRTKEQLPEHTRTSCTCEGPFYLCDNPGIDVPPGVNCAHELEMIPD